MLTRKNMLNGEFVRAHETLLPAHMRWSADTIRASMFSTLDERPTGAPVWIFAYESLMWNPALAIEEMQRARGDIGTNAGYVWKLRSTLGVWGTRDDYVTELALALHEAPCNDKLHQQGTSL